MSETFEVAKNNTLDMWPFFRLKDHMSEMFEVKKDYYCVRRLLKILLILSLVMNRIISVQCLCTCVCTVVLSLP